jgi:hypothetical protein
MHATSALDKNNRIERNGDMRKFRTQLALLIAMGLLTTNGAHAEEGASGSVGSSSAINEFPSSRLTVKPFVEAGTLKCNLEASTGAVLNYVPNSRTQTGIEISIPKVMGIAIAGQGPMSSEDELKKGRTDYQDYRLSLNFDSFQLFFSYARYQGFYIENTGYVDPSRSSDLPYLQNREMSLQNINADFLWVASPESFSLKALFDQTVRQEESGGSLLLGLSLQDTVLSSQGPLIPASVRNEFGADQNIERGHFRTALARLGYGYTLVLARKWYAGLGITLGFGVQSSEYSDSTQTSTSTQAPSRTDALGSLGYNGDRYFSGISFATSNTKYSTASFAVHPLLTSVRFFAGTRF